MPHSTKKVGNQANTHRSSVPCEAQQQRLAMTSHTPRSAFFYSHTLCYLVIRKKETRGCCSSPPPHHACRRRAFFASCFRLALRYHMRSWGGATVSTPFRTSFLGAVRTYVAVSNRKKDEKTKSWGAGVAGSLDAVCQRCGVNSAQLLLILGPKESGFTTYGWRMLATWEAVRPTAQQHPLL